MKNVKKSTKTPAAKGKKSAAKVSTPAPAPAPKVAPSTQLVRPGTCVGILFDFLQPGTPVEFSTIASKLNSKDPGQIINDLRRVLKRANEGTIALVGKGTYQYTPAKA